jgi:hypothetical protein
MSHTSWRSRLRIPGLVLGAAAVVGLVANVVVGLTSGSWTDSYKYGEVYVPGRAVLRLPEGSLDISLRELTGGPLRIPPRLWVSVSSTDQGGPVPVRRAVSEEFGPTSKSSAWSYRRIWKARIPRAGEYRVSSGGARSEAGYGLVFGHAPLAIGGRIWAYTALAALAALLVWLVVSAFACRTHPTG